MKPGLSLRMAQQLTLTPQLQQSIRLLQLSTLELAQEVEQMLDDNPFLERDHAADEADQPEPLGHPDEADLARQLARSQALEAEDAQPAVPAQLAERSRADEPASDWAGEEADTASTSHEARDPLLPQWEGSHEGHESDQADAPYADERDWDASAPARTPHPDDDDAASAADQQPGHLSLSAHLHQQALALRLSDEQATALYFLIESLNDDGYLEDPLEQLAAALLQQELARWPRTLGAAAHAQRLAHWQHGLQQALVCLQEMDPTGVGARDLGECLRLQILELRNSPHSRTALRLCEQPLQWLARRDWRRLAQLCDCSEEQARAALALIVRLEPKPGRRFAAVEQQALRPDVIVSAHGRGFKVTLNPELQPRLRLQDAYAQALRQHRGPHAAGLQQRLQEARWFIKNVQQRFDTILRVASAIVEHQRQFLQHGAVAMRPLVLREIADELGLHESTVSRVTSAKFMATPQGTFEFKYFFGSALATEGGGNASSTAVRALIQQLIAAENPQQPLSDQQLADLLQRQGIACARRTVAKYREALRLPTAHLRKTP